MLTTPVLIALGANVSGFWGEPQEAIQHALQRLDHVLVMSRQSRLYRTAPVGPVDQPAFVNAVFSGQTDLTPEALLAMLKEMERQAGRTAGERWGPRPLDLDILDFGARITGWEHDRSEGRSLTLPHPELHRRGFVLVPLRDVAPDWQHPVLNLCIDDMLSAIGGLDAIVPI